MSNDMVAYTKAYQELEESILIALDDACNITGEFSFAAASTIPCIISILFTLKAPIAKCSFIDFSNISFVVTNGIIHSSSVL